MQPIHMLDSSMGSVPSAFQGDKAGTLRELSHEIPDMQAVLDRVIQRKILYYSDFEVNLNEWKSENKCLQIYSQTMVKSLSKCLTFIRCSGDLVSPAAKRVVPVGRC